MIMKAPYFLLFMTVFALITGGAACITQHNPAQSSHWYYFRTTDQGEVAATSPLEPEELAKALADTRFIRFENVREFNGAGQWNKAKSPFRDILFVRPQEIKSFEPLEGPPKDFNMQETK